MPEQPTTGRTIDHETLADMLVRSVSEVPGLLRLEPTLTSTLARLRSTSRESLKRLISSTTQSASTAESASTGRDGIHLRIDNGVVQLKLEIATDIVRSCLHTAAIAQQAAIDTIHHAGLIPEQVDVVILSIETNPASAPAPAAG